MEVKDNIKRVAAHIKRLAASKAAPINSDSDNYTRVPRKKKVRTGILPSHKQHGKNTPNNHGAQRYCVLCKNAGMPERKWKSHSSENCFGKNSVQAYVRVTLRGALGNRDGYIKYYQKTENKWRREMKPP